ncbi:glycosyl hydrolase 53 family protein [uncultured Maribacter sp.]|uniref:glycoside hydrolase family 53 protein n=1 Tax=uncultured Maribacter sp. TaxID=431308 RepID=UPI002629AAD3|nr:glycosyl hydrolase 53 family protein [uncultured Maribacter sp.]
MRQIFKYLIFTILITGIISCENVYDVINTDTIGSDFENPFEQKFYVGSDLSYVNEMIDCGATYKDQTGNNGNPYTIFKDAGNNLVRVRLWNNPTWTQYSNIEDVEKTITKSKELGMDVLLDFHYSDTWTDPGNQIIPAAWSGLVDNTEALGQKLYDYTYETLDNLAQKDLLPEIVQVGNEINSNILNKEAGAVDIDWTRNKFILEKGIQAVRDISKKHEARVQVMLHIAKPEDAIWWFNKAKENDIVNYDWIGVSYYPKWSSIDVADLSDAISTLATTHNKKVMIVETGYPFTTENADAANNILGKSTYPATQQGQLEYLLDLKREIKEGNGFGMVYWEPAWVSTECSTLWAQGSHWDNIALFDNDGNQTLGMNVFNDDYTLDTSCATMWILGDGVTDALWNWDNAVELACSENKNKAEINLSQNIFRIFRTQGDWDSGVGYQYFIDRGFTIDSKLKGTGDDDDNFILEGVSGQYNIEIDTEEKTIILSAITSPPYYALGNALPGGWSFDSATLFESPISGVRSATVYIKQETFRFFSTKDDWDSGLSHAYYTDLGYTIDANFENDGGTDANFKFIGTEGEYVLEINDNDKTITLNSTGPLPSLWTVGGAVPGGWNFNTDTVEFFQAPSGVWKANLELSNDVFRFFQTFETWDTNNNYTYYADLGYEIDANLENDATSDANFKFVGTPGKYTLTIDSNTKKITLEEYEALPSLWAVGDAVPGGWGFNGDTVEFLQSSDKIWSAEIVLENDKIFRFFQIFETWDTNNNYTHYESQAYTIDANFENDGSADSNFKFIGTNGTYTLTINGNNKTITLQ